MNVLPVRLDAELIEAFSNAFLSPQFDNRKPTPVFHRETWTRYCSDAVRCATAAPRGHAKTTAFTHAYGLANAVFRIESYIMLLGSSEDKASEQLQNMANELRENAALRAAFHIRGLEQDTKTDIIAVCDDGYRFRIVSWGAEQKIRGMLWRGRRPGLILVDDIEDDEQVENKERRKKFRKWFRRAVLPATRRGGRVRVHGTVLHQDSLLAHLIKNPKWVSRKYAAHRSFNDFSNILWPQQFTEAVLRAERDEAVAAGDSASYSQEYLNDPRDDENRYLSEGLFKAMQPGDWDEFMVLGVGCDFAVSTKDASNRTSFTIGGKRLDNRRAVIDQRVGRWDAKEWIDEMFEIEAIHSPEYWFVEDGLIWRAVEPVILEEMRLRDLYLNILPIKRTKDKAAHGRAFQKEMRANVWMFPIEAPWFPNYKSELLDFSAEAEALLDDQFDSTVNLCLGFDAIANVEPEDELTEDEQDFISQSEALRGGSGRSVVTGY